MSITINTSENKVSITQDTQTLTITNNNNGNTVSIKPADNPTVTIAAPGPQGATGATGAAGSGSGVTSYSELSGIPSGIISSSLHIFTAITASGNISASGDIHGGSLTTDQYVYHAGDLNTYLNFTDDRLRIFAGGISYLDLDDSTAAPHNLTVNDGKNNLDFIVKGGNDNPLFKTDASANRIGTHGKGTPEVDFHIGGSELRVDGNISGSSTGTGSFGYITTEEYIAHKGDVNTAIRFTNNKISFDAGGMTFFAVHDDDSAPFTATVNGGGNTINFRALDENQDILLKTDSQAHNVGLYYAGNEKLSTNTNGIHVTGNISGSASSTGSFSSLIVDGASVDFSGLPTSDPGVAGRLYNDSGTIKISL